MILLVILRENTFVQTFCLLNISTLLVNVCWAKLLAQFVTALMGTVNYGYELPLSSM